MAVLLRLSPETRDVVSKLPEHLAKLNQRKPDHCVVIALNPLDEGPTATINCETSSNVERLTAFDVSVDFAIAEISEEDQGLGTDRSGFSTICVDQVMAGM